MIQEMFEPLKFDSDSNENKAGFTSFSLISVSPLLPFFRLLLICPCPVSLISSLKKQQKKKQQQKKPKKTHAVYTH